MSYMISKATYRNHFDIYLSIYLSVFIGQSHFPIKAIADIYVIEPADLILHANGEDTSTCIQEICC